MARFRRESTQSRRSGNVEPRTRLLVVCGGESTEPAYLTGLLRHRRAGHVTVEIKPKGLAPSGLVTHTNKLLRRYPGEFDEAWCVTDVDNFRDVPDALRAAAPDVRLAISNPCFELWLLLHFEDMPPHCTDYTEAARRLRRHLPKYDKSRLDFSAYVAGVDAAVRRSVRPVDGPLDLTKPFTQVGLLAQRIIGR
ncbi:RloB family protein [Cryptosporangium sp. NPDC048952]|uniref:RloB family protein n=1 Tax=Cryptosporangium sp. NPDC048952 TaxID=3363961 RepID=UPI0037192648